MEEFIVTAVCHSTQYTHQQQQQHSQVGLSQNTLARIDALGNIIHNPEVLRQLQILQEQMTNDYRSVAQAKVQQQQQQQQQMAYLTPEGGRQRKLAELSPSPSPHPVVSLLLGSQAQTLSTKTRINYPNSNIQLISSRTRIEKDGTVIETDDEGGKSTHFMLKIGRH